MRDGDEQLRHRHHPLGRRERPAFPTADPAGEASAPVQSPPTAAAAGGEPPRQHDDCRGDKPPAAGLKAETPSPPPLVLVLPPPPPVVCLWHLRGKFPESTVHPAATAARRLGHPLDDGGHGRYVVQQLSEGDAAMWLLNLHQAAASAPWECHLGPRPRPLCVSFAAQWRQSGHNRYIATDHERDPGPDAALAWLRQLAL